MGRRSTRIALDPVKIAAIVADAGVCPSSGQPVEAYGYRGAGRKFRQIVCRYSDGWRITIHLRADGSVSSTRFDLKLVMTAAQAKKVLP